MFGKSRGSGGRSLKGYEGANLLFFMLAILLLGGFVAGVFWVYKSAGERETKAQLVESGIVSEMVSPVAETCFFYLNARVTATSRTFRNPMEIPVTDDGFARGLFEINGVAEVVLDQKLVMLRKAPKGHWEEILPKARLLINGHLHLHP